MVYFLIFIGLLCFSILFDFKRLEIRSDVFWWLSFSILVLVVAMRYKLGGDTFNYMRDFSAFPVLSELTVDSFVGLKYAPLWILFFSTVKTIYNSFLLFQLVHAIFVNGVLVWFIGKYAKYKFTTLLFYFFYFYLYFNTEILRESISICLFLLAIPAFLANNWKRYYLFVCIAFLFHFSAIILLIFPLLKNLKTNWIYYLVSLLVLFLLSKVVLSFLPPIFTELYNLYVVFEPNLGGYIYTTICFIVFPAVILYLHKTYIEDKFVFESLVFVFFLIAVYTYVSPSIALRFFNYLLPIAAIVFVDLVGDLLFKRIAITSLLVLLIPSVILFKSQEYLKDTSSIMPGTKFYFRWYPYTHIFNVESKSQFDIIEKREKWVDVYFNNLVDDVNELSL